MFSQVTRKMEKFFRNKSDPSFPFLIVSNYNVTNAVMLHIIFTSICHWFKTEVTVNYL